MTAKGNGVQYRVTAPIVQVFGLGAGMSEKQQVERTFYHGHIIPSWVPESEVARLVEFGVLEVLA